MPNDHENKAGEQAGSKMGAEAGKQVGGAVGAAIAGPAGQMIGEKIGAKLGSEMGAKAGAQMDKKTSGESGQNKDSTSKLLNDSDETINRVLGNVTGVLAAKSQNSGQSSFFSRGAKDEDLQKNQAALQNASGQVQDLKAEHGEEAKSSNSYSYTPAAAA